MKEPLVLVGEFVLLLCVVTGLGRFCYDLWVHWHSLREGVPTAMEYAGLWIILFAVLAFVQLLVISYLLDRFQRRR